MPPRAHTSEPRAREDVLSRRRLSSTQLYVPPSPRNVFSHEVTCSNHAYDAPKSLLSNRGVFMTTSPRELNADRSAKGMVCGVHSYRDINSPSASAFHYNDNASIPNAPLFGQRHSTPRLPEKSPSGSSWTRLHELPPPPSVARRLYNSPTLTSVLPPQHLDEPIQG